ncbi:hypothetical protein PC119_g20014 [Phytophthora cactorum]|nr:hypothetical protein PC119_g20014 [Phytophthora cactorum]KAG3184758.1 hypothetical protein C6341_g4815 [Phytophthora cactorum]
MRTAWDRAFKTLSVRLSLAQRKTNTVHQRVKLESAIIIPKLLYVGRHAWPSQDVVTEADNRIKNFIWRSSFARTDRAPAGWVGKWALAENPLTQMIGDILQLPHGLHNCALVPRHCKIPCKLRKSIWETGRPWTELHWAQDNPHDEEQEGAEQSLRRLLKLRTAHLIWRYPWARKVWTEMIQDWQSGNEQHGRNSDRLLGDIFGLRLRQTPDWLVVWAKDRPTDLWDRLHAVGQDLWRLGCVTIFTAIWRWNVEQVHGDNAKRTYQAAQVGLRKELLETCAKQNDRKKRRGRVWRKREPGWSGTDASGFL